MIRSRSLLYALLGILPFSIAFTGVGQEKKPADTPKQPPFECRFATGPIVIDGKGDDVAWKNAEPIDNFYLPWLRDPRPSKTKTKAKLLWDREYLYFFADMEDADLYAYTTEHNGELWYGDVFELFFKPADDKPGYYEFQVNPAAAVLDCFMPRRNAGGFNRFKNDTKFHIDAKVQLRGTLNKWTDRDEGWTVEGRIPWTDFMRTGGRPEVGEKWKFALCRYDYSVDLETTELSTTAPLKAVDFHRWEDYAPLIFVGPQKVQGGIEKRIPLTTSKVVGFPDPPPPYTVKRVYPDMKMTWPMIPTLIPGSDEMLIISLTSSYGKTKIQRMKDDPAVKSWDLWLESTDTAYQIEFHPKFLENGFVFIGSNGSKPGTKEPKKTRVTRYTIETKPPHKIIPGSEKIIIEWDSDGQNGGAPAFGHDGMLYITTGDGTSDSDTNLTGQDMSTILGKVIRIDVDHPDPGKTYSVPKDNPFVNMKDARPEIWALGLRNPWRSSVDKKTGHLWVGSNGQDLWEHVFLIKKGDNYGWSVMEGSYPFYLTRKAGPGPFVKPTAEHHHSESRSLTGGLVYYGKKHPDLVGSYIYGDYSTGKIWAIKHDGVKVLWNKEIADTRLTITGFGIDRHGEILIADFIGDGALYTLVPSPPQKANTFPHKLSDSGLFQSVKGHVVQPGLIPYSVNAVLWSDGTAKQRWLGLPEGGKIDYSTSRGWNFPEKTVIVKSFYLETEEGNPQSRRWIETRFLTKQGNEWYGYSYAWNDEESEGTLIESKGTDREFTVKVPPSKQYPDGVKKFNWHYPSRSECMVCHSRAANWVLGFTELQFNKVHDYGAVKEHQLAVFERLGLFNNKFDWSGPARQHLRKQLLKEKGKKEADVDAFLAKQTATRDQRTAVASVLLPLEPENMPHLVDPYDTKQDITLRARSYLHSNCAQCHVGAGGGNSQIDLDFNKALDKMELIDAKPLHDTFGIKDAKLVAPGHPERSVLLHRIGQREKGHMPPLATRLVDERAVALMREWILQLKADKK